MLHFLKLVVMCDDSVKHAAYMKDSVSQSMIYTRAAGGFGHDS